MSDKGEELRISVAQEAARLMLDGGIRDHQLAKRKAAERYGVSDRGALPTNLEIEEARAEHLRLFHGASHAERLARLRQAALEAMDFLADFEPRLTGAVLAGTADEHSCVELHLFTDASEEVGLLLLQHNIPHELVEKRLRLTPGDYRYFPAYRFMAGDAPIELLVMPLRASRQPPLSPVTGKAMRRLTSVKLKRMLEREAAADAAD